MKAYSTYYFILLLCHILNSKNKYYEPSFAYIPITHTELSAVT